MQALILAAGKGTRLKEMTANRPKPMVPVAGKPCLEWIVEGLQDAGIRDLVVVTGYQAEVLESYFGDGARWGVSVRYVRQTVQDGTGGAVRAALPTIGSHSFLMTYGDILMAPANYRGIQQEFQRRPCGAVVGLNWVADPYRGAAVYLGPDQVVERIVEKPPQGTSETHWNNAGLMVFGPEIGKHIESLPLSPRGEYELPTAITKLMKDGGEVRGFPLEGLWGDIGTPEELTALSTRLACGDWSERRDAQ